jgi:hypothetical protein
VTAAGFSRGIAWSSVRRSTSGQASTAAPPEVPAGVDDAPVGTLGLVGAVPLNAGDVEPMVVEPRGGRLLIIETSALPPTARARRVYERRGFSAWGRVPDFYGDGDDKMIYAARMPGCMRLPLDSNAPVEEREDSGRDERGGAATGQAARAVAGRISEARRRRGARRTQSGEVRGRQRARTPPPPYRALMSGA